MCYPGPKDEPNQITDRESFTNQSQVKRLFPLRKQAQASEEDCMNGNKCSAARLESGALFIKCSPVIATRTIRVFSCRMFSTEIRFEWFNLMIEPLSIEPLSIEACDYSLN